MEWPGELMDKDPRRERPFEEHVFYCRYGVTDTRRLWMRDAIVSYGGVWTDQPSAAVTHVIDEPGQDNADTDLAVGAGGAPVGAGGTGSFLSRGLAMRQLAKARLLLDGSSAATAASSPPQQLPDDVVNLDLRHVIVVLRKYIWFVIIYTILYGRVFLYVYNIVFYLYNLAKIYNLNRT